MSQQPPQKTNFLLFFGKKNSKKRNLQHLICIYTQYNCDEKMDNNVGNNYPMFHFNSCPTLLLGIINSWYMNVERKLQKEEHFTKKRLKLSLVCINENYNN
jgi:hypothetical protein